MFYKIMIFSDSQLPLKFRVNKTQDLPIKIINIRFFLLTIAMLAFSPLLAQERYRDVVFSDVSRTTHTHADKGDEKLQLDAFRPEGDTEENRPLLLYVHGGGFSGGAARGGNATFFELPS